MDNKTGEIDIFCNNNFLFLSFSNYNTWWLKLNYNANKFPLAEKPKGEVVDPGWEGGGWGVEGGSWLNDYIFFF